MATPKDYQVATLALANVINAAINTNVPGFLKGEIAEHQAMIDQIESSGAKAVVDAVDKYRQQLQTAAQAPKATT
jgi:hypothetical protein